VPSTKIRYNGMRRGGGERRKKERKRLFIIPRSEGKGGREREDALPFPPSWGGGRGTRVSPYRSTTRPKKEKGRGESPEQFLIHKRSNPPSEKGGGKRRRGGKESARGDLFFTSFDGQKKRREEGERGLSRLYGLPSIQPSTAG